MGQRKRPGRTAKMLRRERALDRLLAKPTDSARTMVEIAALKLKLGKV